MNGRLQALKDALNVEWGELATMLDVSRSWLDQMRGGTRPGPKLERRLQGLELKAGLRTAPSEESLLCESPAEYVVSQRSNEQVDKTDRIVIQLQALSEQVRLLTRVMNMMMDRDKNKE